MSDHNSTRMIFPSVINYVMFSDSLRDVPLNSLEQEEWILPTAYIL